MKSNPLHILIFTLMFPGTSVISAAPDVWPPLVESPGPLVFLLET